MKRIADQIESYDYYIAITRGGLMPTLLLSQITGQKNIDTICLSSYDGKNQQNLVYNKKDYLHIMGKNILLIDDLADSGKTFVEAKKILEAFNPKRIDTCAIYVKEHSIFIPDYFIYKVGDQWLDFKYEQNQQINSFV